MQSLVQNIERLKTRTREATEAHARLGGDTIKHMAREIPLAQTELAALAESGSQLGVKIGDLPDFVAMTAKMAVAFDMAANKRSPRMRGSTGSRMMLPAAISAFPA
ncbi:hypothetical protein [Hydrogenophilus hirschii]